MTSTTTCPAAQVPAGPHPPTTSEAVPEFRRPWRRSVRRYLTPASSSAQPGSSPALRSATASAPGRRTASASSKTAACATSLSTTSPEPDLARHRPARRGPPHRDDDPRPRRTPDRRTQTDTPAAAPRHRPHRPHRPPDRPRPTPTLSLGARDRRRPQPTTNPPRTRLTRPPPTRQPGPGEPAKSHRGTSMPNRDRPPTTPPGAGSHTAPTNIMGSFPRTAVTTRVAAGRGGRPGRDQPPEDLDTCKRCVDNSVELVAVTAVIQRRVQGPGERRPPG